ncbi:MAG: BMA_0021/BMA_0022 family TOMM bacteriocin [Marinobacterium sp.]|nr:BMA_0021/BMA_0022 family TOMM bacteriocin [Marinobacterium sp.]
MSDTSKVKGPTSTYQDFINLRAVIVRSVGLGWRNKKFQKEFMKDPAKAMESTFGYKFPFGFEFSTWDADNSWTPELTGGWSGENNRLVMMLPPKPENPEEAAEALAAYNLERLNFFSK